MSNFQQQENHKACKETGKHSPLKGKNYERNHSWGSPDAGLSKQRF